MRNFWHGELPIGDPHRGAPFGERTDPSTIGAAAPSAQSTAGAIGGMGSILNFIGNMNAGASARGQGEAQRVASEFEAAQLNQSAGQAAAAAQRKALDERRRAALVVSRGLAVAAASGAGASDSTVTHLLADVEGEGAYRAGVALYEGEERSRQLRTGADAKVYEGRVLEKGGRERQRAYQIAGFGGLATGGASIYGKYGMGGPKKASKFAAGAAPEGAGWVDAGTDSLDVG